jgi:hypothetical protein
MAPVCSAPSVVNILASLPLYEITRVCLKPFKLRFGEIGPEALEALCPDLWKHSINSASSELLAPWSALGVYAPIKMYTMPNSVFLISPVTAKGFRIREKVHLGRIFSKTWSQCTYLSRGHPNRVTPLGYSRGPPKKIDRESVVDIWVMYSMTS